MTISTRILLGSQPYLAPPPSVAFMLTGTLEDKGQYAMTMAASNAMTINPTIYKDPLYPSSLYLATNSYASYTNAIEPTVWPVDFTYECTVRVMVDNQCTVTEIKKGNTNSFRVGLQGRRFSLELGSVVGTTLGSVLTADTWNHFAVAGDAAAGVMRTFVNGVSTGAYSFSQFNFVFSGGTVNIGGIGYTPNCYIGGVRLMIGTCLYKTAFTVPATTLFPV